MSWQVGGGHKGTVQFQVEPVRGGEGCGVYAGGMGEMQEDDRCEEPRAIVMSCCKSIIQGDAFW